MRPELRYNKQQGHEINEGSQRNEQPWTMLLVHVKIVLFRGALGSDMKLKKEGGRSAFIMHSERGGQMSWRKLKITRIKLKYLKSGQKYKYAVEMTRV